MTLMPCKEAWLHGKVGQLQALCETCPSSLSAAFNVVLNLWHVDSCSFVSHIESTLLSVGQHCAYHGMLS